MQLTVREVAKLLKVTENTVYRWLKSKQIPAYKVREQYRFNKSELIEWVASNRIDLQVDLFANSYFEEKEEDPQPTLVEALTNGGIFYKIKGDDKESVLRSVVQLMRLPDEYDRDLLLKILLAREDMASTSIGNGIAIPHVRNPIIFRISKPMICLSFLEKPIDFGALDKQKVHTLFSIICPSTRMHLHLISRLGFALHDSNFMNALLQQSPEEEILSELKRIENKINANKQI